MSVSASRIVCICPNKIAEVSKSCSFGYFLEGRSCGSGSSRNGLNTIIRKSKSKRRRTSCSPPSAAAGVGGDVSSSTSEKIHDLVLKQAALFDEKRLAGCSGKDVVDIFFPGNLGSLTQAYDLCSKQYLQTDRNSTFYYGTLLVPPEKRRAFWAFAVWIRKIDELVDGPNGSQITPSDVESWVSRLEHIFQGRPSNLLDAALSDTVAKFHIDIQPFKDVIEGMKMDLWKSRYKNFDELYLYTYYVSGTLALISVPIVGIAPQSRATTESVFNTALAIGTATQLTNILRDVGEDARRGRIYLPQDELAQAGLSDDDIFAGKVTDKWRSFMKQQIKRARMFFDEAERGFPELSADCRWAVWASSLFYRQILDEIEANDYNNFTKRARLSLPKKILTLSCAYARSLAGPSSTYNIA